MKQSAAYALVALLAIGSAFAFSFKYIGSLRAQEDSSAEESVSDELPPEPLPAEGVPAQGEAADLAAPPQSQLPPADAGSAFPTTSSNSGIAELEGFLEPFIYDVANRRDPFLAFAEFIPQEEGPMRALTPAQRFALEELRLVGVMWEVKDPKAMFMDPDDEVLVLGRDESIGNRNGYIAAIREGEVVVVEAIRKRGDIIYRTRVLRIER